jgi:hypothetical protein
MTEKRKTEIIIIHESMIESWGKDAGTFALIVSLISVGVYLESSPMQWLGAIMAMIFILFKSISHSNKMTITEARARLDELEKKDQ